MGAGHSIGSGGEPANVLKEIGDMDVTVVLITGDATGQLVVTGQNVETVQVIGKR